MSVRLLAKIITVKKYYVKIAEIKCPRVLIWKSRILSLTLCRVHLSSSVYSQVDWNCLFHTFLSWVSVAAYPCAHAKIQINMIISLLGTLNAYASRFLSRQQVSREQFYVWKSSKKTVLLSSWSRKTHLQILVH